MNQYAVTALLGGLCGLVVGWFSSLYPTFHSTPELRNYPPDESIVGSQYNDPKLDKLTNEAYLLARLGWLVEHGGTYFGWGGTAAVVGLWISRTTRKRRLTFDPGRDELRSV